MVSFEKRLQMSGDFGHFPKYHMKIPLGDFNAKLGREDFFRRLGMRVHILIVMIIVLY